MTQSVASSCCDIPQLPAAAPTQGGALPAAAQSRAPRARFSIRAEETSNALPCEDEDEDADELVSWRLRLQRQRQLLPERRRQQQVLAAYRSRRHVEEQAHLQLQQLLREASTGSAGSAAQRAGASEGAGSDGKETGQEAAPAPTELQRLLGPLMPPAATVEDWRVLLCSWEEVVATAARRSSPADGGGSGGNDSPGVGGGEDAASAAAEWPAGCGPSPAAAVERHTPAGGRRLRHRDNHQRHRPHEMLVTLPLPELLPWPHSLDGMMSALTLLELEQRTIAPAAAAAAPAPATTAAAATATVTAITTATAAELLGAARGAFHAAALRWHPDKCAPLLEALQPLLLLPPAASGEERGCDCGKPTAAAAAPAASPAKPAPAPAPAVPVAVAVEAARQQLHELYVELCRQHQQLRARLLLPLR